MFLPNKMNLLRLKELLQKDSEGFVATGKVKDLPQRLLGFDVLFLPENTERDDMFGREG